MRINTESEEYWGNPTPTYTIFDSSGLFAPTSSNGEMFWLQYDANFIRVDANIITSYTSARLYKLGASGASATGRELIYQFDGGEYGTLGFYGFPDTSYSYQRNGDRLIMDVGDGVHTNTFVITDGGLVLSGGGKYTKFNPNKVY